MIFIERNSTYLQSFQETKFGNNVEENEKEKVKETKVKTDFRRNELLIITNGFHENKAPDENKVFKKMNLIEENSEILNQKSKKKRKQKRSFA